MSDHKPAPAAAPTAEKVGGLRALTGWMRKKPLIAGGLLMGVVAAMIGGGVVLTLAFHKEEPKPPAARIAVAMDRLDAGDLNEARRIAAELRGEPTLSDEESAAVNYVLGVVSSYDAEDFSDERRRHLLFRVAARYLEEARDRGFPAGREAEGLFLIGKCLIEGGRPPAAVLALEEALEAPQQPHRTEIYRLLAEARLADRPPQIAAAIQAIETYLQDTGLAPRDRWSAILWQARVQLENGDLEGSRKTLAALPEQTPLRAEAQFLEARLLLAEGDKLREPNAELTPDSTSSGKYAAAIDKLRGISDPEGAEAKLTAQVQYLLGVALEKQGDDREAETQFTRVRRQHYGTPESLAATLHSASLQLAAGQHLGAVDLFRKTLSEIEAPYENVWEPQPALESRLQKAFDHLLQAKDFEFALQLAESWSPLIAEHHSLLARADAHRAWAMQLEQELATVSPEKRDVQAAEARSQWRKAGALYHSLSAHRRATKFFEDDLWHSAEANLNGWSFVEAAARCREFLKENARNRRPEALASLGQALLADGDLPGALEAFESCLKEYPKHPASYRARLLAAAALDELDRSDDAREMLVDNLYNFALTPQSSEWRDSIFALGENQFRSALTHEMKSRQLGVDDRNPERHKAGLAELEKAQLLFLDAVKTLTEAVARFPKAPQGIEARYRIAESYRQAAKWPRKRLGSATIETTRVALNTQLQQHLASAVDEYAKLLQALDDEQNRRRSATDAAILRNCYFARADALFDLGRYDEAVAAYSAATNRYQHEPEALEAYVQVAACHRRMNKASEARGTIEQAKVVLRRIRPDADFTRTTRYSRDQWLQVLDWLATL